MDLLFAHGDDGRPMLGVEPDAATAAAEASPIPARPAREERFLADVTADANDLARQGWAVVAPAGPDGDRLVALVRDLAAHRAEEQGAATLELRVPPGLSAEAADAWIRNVYPARYGEEEARRPRYLLILGDLDGVSLDTQQALARDGLVGRLACAADDGYAAYAAKVRAWERAPSRHDRARALFYTVHDGTRATAAGHTKLVQPCHDRCARTARDKARAFPASAVELHGAPSPDPDELLALAAARHPSVLLSMSHGMGPPRRRPWSPAEARAHQGSMSFGAEGALAAPDVAARPFLPGGLWIYFACFGAGTPRTSAYHHWLDMLARHGMDGLGPVSATLRGLDQGGGGFVSGLAKAALANPDGPLAVLGHIDLAWSYSYEELRVAGDRRVTGSNRSLNFFNVMGKLVAGERAGAASLALRLQQAAVSAALTAHYDRCKRAGAVEGETPAEALALGNLWMLHQDLLGYALLGDPAVRLPLARRAAGESEARRAEAPATAATTTTAAAAAPAAGSALDRLEQLEQAALAVAGGASPGAIAAQLGLPRSEIAEAAEVYRAAGRAALSALLETQERGRAR